MKGILRHWSEPSIRGKFMWIQQPNASPNSKQALICLTSLTTNLTSQSKQSSMAIILAQYADFSPSAQESTVGSCANRSSTLDKVQSLLTSLPCCLECPWCNREMLWNLPRAPVWPFQGQYYDYARRVSVRLDAWYVTLFIHACIYNYNYIWYMCVYVSGVHMRMYIHMYV